MSQLSTMENLRALHDIIGQALGAIERVYLENGSSNGSPSSTPSTPCSPSPSTPTTPAFPPGVKSEQAKSTKTTLLPSLDVFSSEDALVSPPLSPVRSSLTAVHRKATFSTPPRITGYGDDLTPKPVSSPRTPFASLIESPITFAPQTGSPLPPSLAVVTPITSSPLARPSIEEELQFPSLDAPYSASSPEEVLSAHPDVVVAINEIVAACGQLTASVQNPFLTICDAVMSFHLPSCMRLLVDTRAVDIMQRHPDGAHVDTIAAYSGVDSMKLSHVLRLLATHHILREVAPDVFANNRVSGFIECGLPGDKQSEIGKDGTFGPLNSIGSFVGMNTDELFKASAYMTDAYLLDPATRASRDPTKTPFNFAFNTPLPFFAWLEEEGLNPNPSLDELTKGHPSMRTRAVPQTLSPHTFDNKARLERFGRAMTGTGQWEAPNAIFNAIDWNSLAPGSKIVDVGGGIGSTTMVLANEFPHLKFVVQDRPVVVDMGVKAWEERLPALLGSQVTFQNHDFFREQPNKDATIFLMRVITHDWSDDFAQRILLRLREAAVVPKLDAEGNVRYEEGTRLILGDFVLPLACVDEFGCGDGLTVDGATKSLARAPLLANLGKANSVAYWMDITMQVTFNSQERTLRETVTLAASAGWKVVKVARASGSSFGHVICVPTSIPAQRRLRGLSNASLLPKTASSTSAIGSDDMAERSISRCGTPSFGSCMKLPSREDVDRNYGGVRARGGGAVRGRGRAPTVTHIERRTAVTINAIPLKKKASPSPLAHRLQQSPRAPLSPSSHGLPLRQRSRTTLMTSPPPRTSGVFASPTPPPSARKAIITPRMTPPSPAPRPRTVHSPTPRKRSGSIIPSPPTLLTRKRGATVSRPSNAFGMGLAALTSNSIAEGCKSGSPGREPVVGGVLGAAAKIERPKR